MNVQTASASSDRIWEKEILPALERYIRIPNKSPAFDPDWVKAGHMEAAVQLIAEWCRAQAPHLPGLTLEVVRLKDEQGRDRTPVIYMEVPGTRGDDTVLMYGHLDKQPEMTGWREGLTPWTPVREGDKLYGRGGADDGYSAFASLTALRLLREQGIPHARTVVLIEACEESGSYDLPAYIEALAPRIGKPSLVVCLDSGCANYEQLWMTTSLRGMVAGNLRVDVLTEGVHSGDASGIVASSFRVLRQVLSRVEEEGTGRVTVQGLHVEIPQARREQAKAAAKVLGEEVFSKFPWVPGMRPMSDDGGELVLNRTWRPALSVTGVEGMPSLQSAGNVLRPFTTVKLSMRIPPRLDPKAAQKALKDALEKDPPYGAKVAFEGDKASVGWDAPPLADWLSRAVETASSTYFGRPAMAMGEGGTIPFMGMLGERFPEAQFLITGLLGPGSNAHGPNEFLHVPTGKKLTCCVAAVIADHFKR
ncbi:M20 family metallopeptidase [Myxococcus sp. K15C18031901]|uniref:M20 family metallopeptidase n=1 Tax=Myxococcus dinghuensis TaxID=2906761 RepID=UPI0020A789BC|nr:M20 family metallopeptidase [Myxococcus dinghuensis]MCP3098269.1 M20 family metallopeptidase [Myxococcus dinghuensis]